MIRRLSTFEHKRGFYIPFDSLCLIVLTGIVFLLAYLEKTGSFDFDYWLTTLLIIWVLSFVTFLISRFFLYEIENGEYKGSLILKEDSILINEIEYDLNEITSIKIYSSDKKGEFVNSVFEFSRHLSNGLNNEITIELKNGEVIKTHFLQTEREKIKFSKNELISYYKKRKFSWLHLLDILEIADYEKIQVFKKELNNKN